MFTKFSQLKQSISDEIEQAVNSHNDPDIPVIEQSEQLMNASTPAVSEIVKELGDPDASNSEKDSEFDGSSPPADSESKTETPSNTPQVNGKRQTAKASTDTQSIETKLQKFAKYEEKYPQLLRAYKIEKRKSDIIRKYEKILSEQTPCKSITDTSAFITFIKNLKSQVSNLEKQVQTLKVELQQQTTKLETKTQQFKDLRTDYDKQSRESKQKISQLQLENEKLKSEHQNNYKNNALVVDLESSVQALKMQLTTVEEARDTAFFQQHKLQSQVDEMSAQIAELCAEKEMLLHDFQRRQSTSSNTSYTPDSTSEHRRQHHHKNDHNDMKTSTLEARMQELDLENKKLTDDLASLESRLLKETEMYNSQIRKLKLELQSSNSELSTVRSSSSINTQLLNPKPELPQMVNVSPEGKGKGKGKSTITDIESERANNMLREAHADNLSRIKRLQNTQRTLNADIEKLKLENEQLKRKTVPILHSADAEKQQAYLKNVLLGFIENKDQRHILLPVLSALLGLKASEEEKFNSLA